MEDKSLIVPGIPVVISGPSGVGKGSIIAEALKRRQEIFLSVSMTSRAPRPGERNGVDYIFVDRSTLLRHIEEGALLEWAEVYGEIYGTPREPVARNLEAGRDVIMEIDVQGGLSVRKHYPSACLVFILPPSREELIRRLCKRGTETEEQIRKRFSFVEYEYKQIQHYNYLIVNRVIEQAAEQLCHIIPAERCKREHLEPVLRKAGILPPLQQTEQET